MTRSDSSQDVTLRVTYTYDALDRRIGVKLDADGEGPGVAEQSWTVYDGVNPYADFNGSGSLTMRYLHGNAVDWLLARTDASNTSAWYLTDRLGTVRDLANTSGTVIYHAAYDSYGAITSTTGSGGDRFGFTGREFDAETSDYHDRARPYTPLVGRFLQQDPIGFDAGDTNLYRYVGNSPTNATDPLGLMGFIGRIGDELYVAGQMGVGAVTGAIHGGAMVINAVTGGFIGPLDRHVHNLIDTHGGLYGAANISAGVAGVAGGLATGGYGGGMLIQGIRPGMTAVSVSGSALAVSSQGGVVITGQAVAGMGVVAVGAHVAGANAASIMHSVGGSGGGGAPRGTGIVAQNGTRITGYTGHGVDRAIGDGANRAGVNLSVILDTLKNPVKITSGIDSLGRPFQVFTGQNARVVVNPQTGQIVSVNPLSGAGVR